MSRDGQDLPDALHEAADHIRQCRDMAPDEGKQCFRKAFEHVVRARNELLRDPGHPRMPHLNGLLSLMSSVEFPLAGIHHERLHAASEEIHRLLERAES